jgi:lipopolysaccharide export system permease protein
MYHVIAHHPGGQPIGALEAAFAKVGKVIRKLLPRPGFQRIEPA